MLSLWEESKSTGAGVWGKTWRCHTFSATTWAPTSPKGNILLSVHHTKPSSCCTGADNLGAQIEGGNEGAAEVAGEQLAGGIEAVAVGFNLPSFQLPESKVCRRLFSVDLDKRVSV